MPETTAPPSEDIPKVPLTPDVPEVKVAPRPAPRPRLVDFFHGKQKLCCVHTSHALRTEIEHNGPVTLFCDRCDTKFVPSAPISQVNPFETPCQG